MVEDDRKGGQPAHRVQGRQTARETWDWIRTGVPAPEPGPARKVIVVVRETPTRDQVTRLAEFMRQLPGQNSVELHLPDGSVPVRSPCGLSPAYEPYVAVILGGAAVHYDADPADVGKLTADLEL